MPRSVLVAIALAGFIATACAARPALAEAEASRSAYGAPGTIDFIEYWTAHALMSRGANPYDAAAMLHAQQALGRSASEPVMMWNPPWLVTLMSPVLALPFELAAKVWLALGVVMTALAASAIIATYRGRFVVSPALLAATFLFHPSLLSWSFGQLGSLHALAIAVFVWAACSRRDGLAGLALVPLSVKPHLVYLAAIVIAYWIVRVRAYRVMVAFALGLAALVALTWFLYPQSLGQWREALSQRPPLHWMVGTAVGALRAAVYSVTAVTPTWPLSVVPGVSALALVAWLARRKPEPDLRWLLPPVLSLSLFTAPYGWVFDQAQLLIVQVALIALAERERASASVLRRIAAVLLVVQLGSVATSLWGRALLDFFWVSLALAGAWLYGVRELTRAVPALRSR